MVPLFVFLGIIIRPGPTKNLNNCSIHHARKETAPAEEEEEQQEPRAAKANYQTFCP